MVFPHWKKRHWFLTALYQFTFQADVFVLGTTNQETFPMCCQVITVRNVGVMLLHSSHRISHVTPIRYAAEKSLALKHIRLAVDSCMCFRINFFESQANVVVFSKQNKKKLLTHQLVCSATLIFVCLCVCSYSHHTWRAWFPAKRVKSPQSTRRSVGVALCSRSASLTPSSAPCTPP